MQAVDTFDNEHTGGTMSALRKENGNGGVEIFPTPEGILDQRGKPVAPSTFMARLNEKSKDEFTITKGMATIIAIALTAVGLFLGYIIPEVRQGARESEKVLGMEKEIQETRDDMRELKTQFGEIQKALQAQAVKDAETKGKEFGYQVGRSDKQGGH